MNDPQQWIVIGFTASLIVAGFLSLICIFLYNNRHNQIKWTAMAISFQTIVFGFGIGLLVSLGGFGIFLWEETVGAVILLIALLATCMARKKIKDDEELVQSMDRIR